MLSSSVVARLRRDSRNSISNDCASRAINQLSAAFGGESVRSGGHKTLVGAAQYLHLVHPLRTNRVSTLNPTSFEPASFARAGSGGSSSKKNCGLVLVPCPWGTALQDLYEVLRGVRLLRCQLAARSVQCGAALPHRRQLHPCRVDGTPGRACAQLHTGHRAVFSRSTRCAALRWEGRRRVREV